MYFQFATCERNRALEFLKKLYLDREVADTPEDAGPLLDIVEKDIVRIPDPDMHGSRVEICQSKNWVESEKESYIKILTEFHNLSK